MKKSLFLIPALALALASCSNDDPSSNSPFDGPIETNYLSINLVPAPDNATRAEGETTTGDPNATYEEGYAKENKVSKVRFYFFDAQGNAAAIKTDGKNYFDWEAEDNQTQDMPNVEKQLKAVVVINTTEDSGLPSKMVAILNPEVEGLSGPNATDNLSLSQLEGRIKDYAATVNGTTSSNFVMINSVYAEGTKKINATPITSTNYAKTSEDAIKNPINIYVERCVAKVRVQIDGSLMENNRIALKDSKGEPIQVNNKQVFLELSEWNLTAETNNGNLLKNIDATNWDANLFGNSRPWNYDPYFRSYWAQNPSGATQQWHSYKDIANGAGYGSTKNSNVIYTNENAPQVKRSKDDFYEDTNIEKFTKVILAGKLVDESGEAIEVTKYAGITSVGEDALISSILANLGGNMIYSYETTGGETVFKALEAKDVKLKTAIAAGVNGVTKSETTTGRYNVYLQLKDENDNSDDYTYVKKNWSKSNNPESLDKDKLADDAAVNAHLATVIGKAQVYKGGQTYYYFPIKHLGGEKQVGEYGVVRNHIYDCTIKTLTGLGTPVYDPDETIYPEKPDEDDTFIAAQINILSWRLVTDDVSLTW